MPRRSPDQVVEQRVTLGNLERNLIDNLNEVANSKASLNTAQVFKIYAEGVNALAVPVVAGMAVILGAHVYSEAKTMLDGLPRSPLDVPLRIVRNPDPSKPDIRVSPRQIFSISPLRALFSLPRRPGA